MSASYRTALRLARGAAAAAPSLAPGLLDTVRENLRLAYGRHDPVLARAVFRHFAEAAVDTAFFGRLFRAERFAEHFRFVGGALEHFRETAPAAAVFVTGHFGNWELFGASFSYVGIPIAPVARPPEWRPAARALDRFRRGWGQETIPKRHALPLALKALRRGRCVAFLLDQAAGRHGIEVPFFERPAWTYTAPAALALKTGLPLYAGYSTRLGPGIRYRCHAETVPVDGGVEAVTARLNRILEGYVRARPEQWWWFHKRWKPPRAVVAGRPVSPAGVPL